MREMLKQIRLNYKAKPLSYQAPATLPTYACEKAQEYMRENNLLHVRLIQTAASTIKDGVKLDNIV